MTKKMAIYALAGLAIMLVLVMGMAVLSPLPLHAQTFYGSIVGTVTDSSGAAVPGAAVTITDIATNEKRSDKSDSAGNYRFVNLVPAAYKVEVQKANFKRFVSAHSVVQVGDTLRVDAALQVGAVSETVEVTTQAPLLETESGTLGATVEGKTVTEMPLNGRNTMNLLSLAPGVVPGGSASGAITANQGGHTNSGGWGNYQIGGGIEGQSAMYVDGAPLNILGGNNVGYVPTQDAVQEFNVATNAVSAEYGRFAGGVVNMTTKSGTNAWHGSAYEYLRNSVFNANEWFNKQSELLQAQANKPAQWNQNQYGGVFSGPIKKDKAFFLFSWEGFAARTAKYSAEMVPTPDMMAGWIDNTDLTDSSAIPAGCASLGTSPSGVANSTEILSNCWDKSSAVIMTMWPAQKFTLNSQNNNYGLAAGTGSNIQQYTGRVDYNISANQRFFARYSYMKTADLSQAFMPGAVAPNGYKWLTGGGATHIRTQSAVMGDTYTFSPTTILDARLSYMRVYNDQIPPSAGMDLSFVGANWGALAKNMTATNNPGISFGHDLGVAGFRGNNQLSWSWNDTYALNASLTKIVSKHSLKFGGEARYMDQSALNGGSSANLTTDNSYYAQNSWANFLLGLASEADITTDREVAAYNWYQGYYVNDSWQALRKLTVNLGLRWELSGNIKEKQDRAMVLLPTVTDSTTGAYGTVALVNSALYSDRGTEPARHDLFAPRVSFAYRLTNNDSIRGGYAYNIVAPDMQQGMFPANATINQDKTTWSYPNQVSNLPNKTDYTVSNPFPGNTFGQPAGRAGFTTTQYLQQSLNAPVPTTKYPYTQEWNLSVSHQFKGDWMLEVGYAGSLGTHLPIAGGNGPGGATGFNLNELNSTNWANRTMELSNATACGPWAAGTTTVAQCSKPHPAYLTFGDMVANYGSTNYHSMPVRLEKRFQSGGVVTLSYTFAKMIGDTDTTNAILEGQGYGGSIQDWNNLKAERSISASDIPNRLVASYVLNLPFGKGQKFLANGNSIVDRLVSGWSANGITTFQTGNPLSISASESNGVTNVPTQFGAGSLRANYVGNSCVKTVSGSAFTRVQNNDWFNVACFAAPPVDYSITTANGVSTVASGSCPPSNGGGGPGGPGGPGGGSSCTGYATTLGNEPRVDSLLRAQGIDNWDFSAQKVTKITERTSLEIRFEFFNVFNHVQYDVPGVSINPSGPFGGVPGAVTDSKNNPRQGQASLRFSF
jgi:hypothetical protein